MRTTGSRHYGARKAGSTAIASAAPRGTSHPPGSRRAMPGSVPTSASMLSSSVWPSGATFHQPFGPPDEDHRHQQVDADAAPFGEEHLAEGVDETDQERGDEGAGDRANAADDDDDEADDEHAR